MTKVRHIGILTGGGDCPGLNAVIRAITKSAIIKYGIEVIGFMDGFRGLVENNYMALDLRQVSGISHTGGTILGTSNRDNPFAFITVTQEGLLKTDESDRAMLPQASWPGRLIVIGGDGTLVLPTVL